MERTPEDPRPLGASRALGIGLTQALSLPGPTLLLFGLNAVSVLSGLAVMLLLVRLLFGGDPVAYAGATVGGLVTLWLLAKVLRALVLGAGLGQAADRISDAAVRPIWVHAVSSVQETLPYALISWALGAVISGWKWLALIAAGWLYGLALVTGEGGFFGSAALALALTLALPLGFLLALWVELALVRAVHHREDYIPTLIETIGALAKRPWVYVWITFILGAFAWMIELAVGGFASIQPRLTDPVLAFGASAYAQLVTGLIVALAAAILDFARLYAFLAIVMDQGGELPSRYKPAAPLVEAIPISISSAEVVIDAIPVDEPKPST